MPAGFLTENKTMQIIRSRVAFHSRQHEFDKCMQQIVASPEPLPGSLIAELYASWGDPLSSSDESFMRSCVSELNSATGPVLLCGASLLTLILGALCDAADEKAKQIWCLEQDSHWANLIRSWITEYRIGAAHVIQSRAKFFDDTIWYSVDTGRLAKSYQLIVCDGARATPKGILGTLARMEGRLDDRFTVLARNVKETTDLQALNQWAKSRDAKFALIDRQQGFVKLTRQLAAPAAQPDTAPSSTSVNQPPTAARPVQQKTATG